MMYYCRMGKQSKREIIHHPGAVAIIPITNEGKIVLVEQYRKALERSIIEIPAGKLGTRRRSGRLLQEENWKRKQVTVQDN